MDCESFERKSWDQDANRGCYETLESNEIEYDVERSQRMDQKHVNGQDHAKYVSTSRICMQSLSILHKGHEINAKAFQQRTSWIEGVRE